MSDGHKRILSPFAGHKKWKTWNKTRGENMAVKRRHDLAETGRGSYTKRNG